MFFAFNLLQSKEEAEVKVHADDLIMFLQLASQEAGQTENRYELGLMTATQGTVAGGKKTAENTDTQLNKVGVASRSFVSLSLTLPPSASLSR